MISLILPCAGSGTRFYSQKFLHLSNCFTHAAELPKQFLKHRGKPLFLHTIRKFTSFKEITQYIFVFSEKEFNFAKNAVLKNLKWLNLNESNCVFVTGGSERYLSVQKSLNLADKQNKFVMIHDAVRPLIHKEDLNSIIERLSQNETALLAVEPVADTIKVIENNKVKENLIRSSLVAASTPQSFPLIKFLNSYRNLETAGESFPTDDTEIYCRTNEPVEIYQLKYLNSKITRAIDWFLVKKLLK